jgi:hypothetical protein
MGVQRFAYLTGKIQLEPIDFLGRPFYNRAQSGWLLVSVMFSLIIRWSKGSNLKLPFFPLVLVIKSFVMNQFSISIITSLRRKKGSVHGGL